MDDGRAAVAVEAVAGDHEDDLAREREATTVLPTLKHTHTHVPRSVCCCGARMIGRALIYGRSKGRTYEYVSICVCS